MEDKKGLRSQAHQNRDAIPVCRREEWSVEIQQKVRDSLWYQEAKIIFSYASYRSEVSTDLINQWALEDGKELYLPRTYTQQHQMICYRVRDLSLLTAGYKGIREPREDEPWDPLAHDTQIPVMMLMPALAYDKKGSRLGYGGGYYDRYLAAHPQFKTCSVAIGYSCQRTQQPLPVEETDRNPYQVMLV